MRVRDGEFLPDGLGATWNVLGVSGDSPLFSGRAPLPYAPKAGSPCINSGADVGWTSTDTDLAGNKRRCGAVVDMGCYEYRSTGLQIILQ